MTEHPELGQYGDHRITKDSVTRMLKVAENVVLVLSMITRGRDLTVV